MDLCAKLNYALLSELSEDKQAVVGQLTTQTVPATNPKTALPHELRGKNLTTQVMGC